jgi:cytochrome c5|tara:strand:- start:98 stop:598 length:501 start_codon:yes stop_codon:yes gene_type:complete
LRFRAVASGQAVQAGTVNLNKSSGDFTGRNNKVVRLLVACLILFSSSGCFAVDKGGDPSAKLVAADCEISADCNRAIRSDEEITEYRQGESDYNKTCVACHTTGVAGAPILGDKAAWKSRLAQGMDAIYQNTIIGLPPGMPTRGMCFTCTDDDLKAIVDYMVESVN